MSILPDGWQLAAIGDIAPIVRRPVKIEDEKLYYQIGIRSHGLGVFHKEPVSGKELGTKRIFWIEPGDFVLNIVFAWEDAVALVSEAEKGMCASHRFPTFVADQDKADARYILRYFQSKDGIEQLKAVSPGGAGRNKTLNQSAFLKVKIPLPPLEEQRKIAAILSTWDEAIGLVERLIAALGRRKQALMQLLLTGAVRFAGFEGEWEEVAVSEFVQSSIAGEWGDEPDSSPETLPVIRSTNFTNDGYLNLAKVAYRKIPSNKIDKLLINVGDILLEKSGGSPDQPVGRVVYFNEAGKFVFANFIQRLVIEENFHPKTILYMLIRYYRSGKIEQFQQQTTGIRNFRLTDFMKEKIRMPRNYQEQVKIAELLTECDQEIEYANTLKVAYQEQKRGLMHQLLTGQVRV